MTPARRKLLAQLNDALADAGSLYTFDDLVELARQRLVQVHQREDLQAIALTELRDHPGGKELNVIAAAGKLRDVLALEPELEALAREEGAVRMVSHGRPAWRPLAAKLGWHPVSLQYVKPILPHNPKEGSG